MNPRPSLCNSQITCTAPNAGEKGLPNYWYPNNHCELVARPIWPVGFGRKGKRDAKSKNAQVGFN